MRRARLDHMTLKHLKDHLLELKRGRGAAESSDAERSEFDREIMATEEEISRRPPPPPTGLETLTVEQILNHFVSLAKGEDEADDIEASDALYWKLDNVRCELERREGDQTQALVALYTHPDIRVRQGAAEFTQTLMPALARSRLLAIDDDNWVPPHDPETAQPVHPKLAKMATKKLVEQFLAIALKQDQALQFGKISKFNRLYWRLKAVELTLKTRAGDQRRALLPFLDHPSAEVRLRTAFAVRELAPDYTVRALRTISKRDEYPQAADARGMLDRFGINWFEERWGAGSELA